MSVNNSEIKYTIRVDNNTLQADANKSASIFKDLGSQAQTECDSMASFIKGIGTALGVAFGVSEIVNFGRKMIEVTGQFQTFRAVLENTLGSPIAAGNAMEMVQDFAASTPFQVDTLTNSFVKLANQGFIPTVEQMTLLGDLASSMGKGFDQLTEAIIDAQTGEFERLKEFGIRASKEGETVTFTFKEQATQVDFTASSIRDYILSLGELEGVQGANAKIAATLTGQMSNLQDGITQMINNIGQSSSGVLSGAISSVSYLVENYENVGRVLGVLIATYGTYKAALIAVTAYQKAMALVSTIQQFNQMTAALSRTTQAQILLNNVVGANPYIKLASALLTVGGLIWAFAEKTDSATQAQIKLNKVISKEEDLLNKSFADIKKSTSGTDDRRKSIENFNSKYGEYLNNLLTEKSTMEEVAIAYERAKNGIANYAIEKAKVDYLAEPTDKLAKYTDKFYNQISDWSMELDSDEQRGRFQSYINQLVSSIRDGGSYNIDALYDAFRASQSDNSYGSVAEWLDALREGKEEFGKSDLDIINLVGGLDTEQANFAGKQLSTFSKLLNEKEEEFENFSKGFKDTLTDITTPNITSITFDVKLSDDNLKSEAEKYSDEFEKYLSSEMKSASVDFIPIDSIAWYEDKISELSEKRKLLTDSAEIGEVDLKIGEYQSKIDDLTGVTDKRLQDERVKNQEYLNDLYSQYATYEQQKLAIAEEYNKKRAALMADGADQVVIDNLNKQEKVELQAVDNSAFDSLKSGASVIAQLFDDTTNKSTEQLNSLRDKTEDLLNYLATTDSSDLVSNEEWGLSTEQLKNLQDAPDKLKAIKYALDDINKNENVFSKLGTDFKALFSDGGFNTENMQNFSSSLNSVKGMITSVTGSLSDMFEASGNEAGAELVTGIEQGLTSVSNIVSGFASGGIIGGAVTVVSELISGFASAAATEAENQAKLEEMRANAIAQQEQYNDLLREQNLLYEDWNNILATDDYGTAKNAITQAQEDLANLKEDIEALSDIKVVSGVWTVTSWFSSKQYNVYSNLLDLYPELIDANGQLDVELAQSIIDTREMSEEHETLLQNAIDSYEEFYESLAVMTDYIEELFGGLGDSLMDSLIDSFKAGEIAAGDFLDSTSSMLEDFVADMIYSLAFAEYFNKASEEIAAIQTGYDADGTANNYANMSDEDKLEAQMGVLSSLYENVNNNMDYANSLLKYAQDLGENYGYENFLSDDADDRTGTSSSVTTASQDSVDEANGRLTAIQGHTYELNSNVKVLNESVTSFKNTFAWLQDNAASQLSALNGIETNTAPIANMQIDITSMKRTLSDIQLKGIKVLM